MMNKSHLNWATPVLAFLLPMLVYLSLSRLLLLIWQFDRVSDTDGTWFILMQGLRFDLVVLAGFLIIPVSLLPLLATNRWSMKPAVWLLKVYFIVLTALLVFLELATPNFIMQFDFRPNILMVEYLKYPKEIMSMLLKAYPLQLLVSVLLTAAAVFGMHRLLKRVFEKAKPSVIWSAPLLSILVFLLCAMAIRSTLDHRPVNPSTVAFSSDPLVNSLPLSSTYSVLYALYENLKYESGDTKPYGEMPEANMMAEIYEGSHLPEDVFFDPDIPTLHHQNGSAGLVGTRPKNLVIILEESLGAVYVGKLGGRDITPNLDKLAEEGIWFDQLYATGTRSVRGIEAVITGFFPTPNRSVVKLGGSQYDFFTIAQLLSDRKYLTSFIYGGEAHFDNMRRFFSNNGFATIIDEKDYDDPLFTGSWGVSDEDLFNKAHELFTEQASNGEPFFSLVFTSTNHSPFDFPDGRIELVEQPKATVGNAIKYSDHALGEYIKKAKQSDYWKDTVFLIVADHGDRVYGNDLVPIKHYRIPGLILGDGIKPRVINRVSSQIDLLPTLLSMIGINSDHPAIGIDLTRKDLDDIPGRAIMQFQANQAYMEGDKVVVLLKDQPIQHFVYTDERLVPSPVANIALENRALAHALWPMLAYKEKSYRLPSNRKNEIDIVLNQPGM
jgi:phosphoglycerol transferase MdoB-like AlkP superfamily enzyme